MNLKDIAEKLDLKLITQEKDLISITPSCGYASDLLSCVMAGAGKRSVWITLQAHANIIAVAALLDLSAIIITEGAMPDPATIQKANDEGIILFSTDKPTFSVAGRLWEMGLRCKSE
jgi:hypothetical protein